jgi:nucleoside-diphosphate-sugar epimerase
MVSPKPLRIAFLGGTRFIGHAASALAVARGHTVTLLHRGMHPMDVAGARELLVDRGDPSALCLALRRLSPDVIVDTRAMTEVDAEVTALASKLCGARVVVLSSQDVYAQFGRANGLPAPEPEAVVTERSPLTVPYPFRGLGGHEGGPDYDKKLVEAVFAEAARAPDAPGVIARGGSAIVLRLPAVYGSRDPKRRFGSIVDRIDAGERIFPCEDGASWRWSHAHVKDVAYAIALAAEAEDAGYRVFNVAEREVPTMRERVDAIGAAMGVALRWEPAKEPLPEDLAILGRPATDLVCDASALRRALAWSEVTRESERIEDIVAWARASRRSTAHAAASPGE